MNQNGSGNGDAVSSDGNGAHANGNGASSNGKRRPEAPSQPRQLLQPFLLLALQQWQSHGYELIGRMTQFGFETLDRASVYRTLRQLEKDGLVVSGWDTSKDGPARRLYSLTDAGQDYLQMWAASLRGYQVMLNNFFTLYPAPPMRGEGQQAVGAEGVRGSDESARP